MDKTKPQTYHKNLFHESVPRFLSIVKKTVTHLIVLTLVRM